MTPNPVIEARFILGLVILAHGSLATTFTLFGLIIGIWAKGFEQLQFIPMLIVTPLTYLNERKKDRPDG